MYHVYSHLLYSFICSIHICMHAHIYDRSVLIYGRVCLLHDCFVCRDCGDGKGAWTAFKLDNFKTFNLTQLTDYKSVSIE